MIDSWSSVGLQRVGVTRLWNPGEPQMGGRVREEGAGSLFCTVADIPPVLSDKADFSLL